MKKVLAMLLALAMVFTLASAALADDAKVLRIGADNEPSTMDPNYQADGQGSMIVGQALFDGLWKDTADGGLRMLVAESYEIVDAAETPAEPADSPSGEASASGELSGKELVVHLRQGSTFSDGNPITADDVIWSFQYSASGTSGAMRLSNVAVNAARAEDDYTVVFPLYSEPPTLLEDLALINILEKAWCEQSDENLAVNPVSSGAYKLASWETGMGIVLEKRDDYFDADNIYYDEIDITFIASEETRLLAFENGDFDIAFLSNSDAIDEINAGVVDGASIVVIPVQQVTGFQMDTTDHETFKDQRVRQAVGYAIDAPLLVTAICGSAFTVADSILPSGNWAYVSCGNYDRDVEKAKSLLAEAGYDESNPFTFTCLISDQGYNTMLAEAAQAMLSEAGIVMNIETTDGATFMNSILGNEIEFSINSYMGSYDPAGVVNARRPGLPAHLSGYGDPELVELLEACCNSTEGQDVRGPMWKELQERSYEYANFIPLYESNVNYAVTAAVDGESLAGSTLADGYLYPNYIRGVG